ncbi:hypothetical protein BLOT_003566 [Blomia tropicalis]|nr:hypothetical protein BLOT_003566 [Blomia tropicalis]
MVVLSRSYQSNRIVTLEIVAKMLSIGTPNERLHRTRRQRSSRNTDGLLPGRVLTRSASGTFPLNVPVAASSANVLPFQRTCSQTSLSKFNLFSNFINQSDLVRWNSNQYGFAPAPLVIAGPSGSGKSTLLKRLMEEFQDCFGFSVSQYYFVNHDEFEQSIQNEEFIEFTRFSNNYYGTSKKAVIDVQSSGKICILDVEMDGVKNLKKTHLNPRFVFIKPPSMEILEDRLRNRGTETEESIKRRLDKAIEELRFGEIEGIFDLTITNDDFEQAYEVLRSFIVEDVEALKRIRGM